MANQLGKIDHIVQLMLENRSFDQMLGFLYEDSGNKSPAGHDFECRTPALFESLAANEASESGRTEEIAG